MWHGSSEPDMAAERTLQRLDAAAPYDRFRWLCCEKARAEESPEQSFGVIARELFRRSSSPIASEI